ncbi:MAG: helix-turn-helix transcriptional regulator [Muribaculaceae bacterium]|nr:helix-turn-helix transcriptional regulator [Muribaculaceae bacterium]
MSTVDEFFFADNEVRQTDELDYSGTGEYIRMAEAFSRSSYQSVYIIDYFKRNFLYVSPNPLMLCGLTPEKMTELGYRFFLEYVPQDELQLLLDINRIGFSFFNSLPVDKRKEWYLQYTFHLVDDGIKKLINHKITPLALTSDGRVWLALCVVSTTNHTSPGHIEMHHVGSDEYFEFNMLTRRWDRRIMPTLTDGEKLVINLSIKGHTMSETAEKMCLSPETVKKYRKQIFEKLGVHNMTEAIIVAINNNLV